MKISVLSLILGMEDLLNSNSQIWYSNRRKLSKSIKQLTIRFSRLSISQKLEIMLSRMLRERRMLGLLSKWWKMLTFMLIWWSKSSILNKLRGWFTGRISRWCLMPCTELLGLMLRLYSANNLEIKSNYSTVILLLISAEVIPILTWAVPRNLSK